MKILFISRLYWPHVGGVERHVAGVAQELIKRGHEVTVLTEQYEPNLIPEEIVSGVKIIRIPIFGISESNKKWVIWKWVFQHQDLFSQMDKIHIHDVVYWIYWYKLIHPTTKIFTTFHSRRRARDWCIHHATIVRRAIRI